MSRKFEPRRGVWSEFSLRYLSTSLMMAWYDLDCGKWKEMKTTYGIVGSHRKTHPDWNWTETMTYFFKDTESMVQFQINFS